MVLAVGPAILASTALATAAKGAGDYFSGKQGTKAAKRRAKETKRETQAESLQNILNRISEMQEHRLKSRQQLGQRKSQSLQDTSDLVRGALKI